MRRSHCGCTCVYDDIEEYDRNGLSAGEGCEFFEVLRCVQSDFDEAYVLSRFLVFIEALAGFSGEAGDNADDFVVAQHGFYLEHLRKTKGYLGGAVV